MTNTNLTAPKLKPLQQLLGTDVSSYTLAVNAQGTVAGASFSARRVETPVTWDAAGVATALPAPLLDSGGRGSVQGCEVLAIGSNASQSIVGAGMGAPSPREKFTPVKLILNLRTSQSTELIDVNDLQPFEAIFSSSSMALIIRGCLIPCDGDLAELT